jgi:hypothetical protein
MSPRYAIQGFFIYIGLMLLQIFIMDGVDIAGFGKPMVYMLFILLAPVSIPAALVMILGFFTGLSLDLLTNSGGLHAASLTMMAFARKFILQFYTPTSGNDKTALPDIEDQGFQWFALYSFLLIVVHQFSYYFIERFSFSNFTFTTLRALSGIVISTILVWLLALLFSPVVRKRKGRR